MAPIALLGALGIALIAAGIPTRRTPSLLERTSHHVAGLRRAAPSHASPIRRLVEEGLSKLSIGTDRGSSARLEAAGRDPSLIGFRIEQFLWGVAGIGVVSAGAAMLLFTGSDMQPGAVVALVGIGGMTAALARDWWLTRQIRARGLHIEEELPVALDLASLAVMAGSSVPAALARAGEVLPGPLGDELRRMSAEIRVGAPISDALDALRERCDLASIDRFVHAVSIARDRGAPVADVLRAQAGDAREIRRRRLMEIAGRREVLMLVPVVFILMPTVILFALYPALVSLELVVP